MSFEDYYYYYNDEMDISIQPLQNANNSRNVSTETRRVNYVTGISPTDSTFVTSSTNFSNYSYNNSTNDSSIVDFVYHYNYEDAISNIPVGEMTVVALVYGLTLLLGVSGNGLVIYSIARIRRMQSVTNIFLTSLATADLLLLLMCVPIKVST